MGDGAGSARAALPAITAKSRLRPRIARIELPEFDPAPYLAADAEARKRPGMRGKRIGVVRSVADAAGRPFRSPANLLRRRETLRLADGSRLWTGEVAAPGALGLRLHFARARIPDGASIAVYDADEPGEAYAVRAAVSADAGVWAPTVYGDRVRIELLIPPGAAGETELEVDEVAHVYSDPAPDEPHAGHYGHGEPRVAACHNRVACDNVHGATTSHGVGFLLFLKQGSVYQCTGSLLADLDPGTEKPWLLTAYHCIGTTEVASTLEVTWDFMEPCVGSAPSFANLPRTTGASLAAASQAYDASLLFLTGSVPGGRYHLPWTLEQLPAGTYVKSVHHPAGAPMKVSSGTIVDYTNFARVLWSSGVTEGGSSGSPLLTPAGEVMGQLWGGASFCDFMEGIDSYGRFDGAWADFTPFLAGDIPPPPVVVTPPYVDPPVPPVPSDVVALAGPAGGAEVRWRENGAGATAIEVSRREGGGANLRLGSVPPATQTYVDATARPGWPYLYRARALNLYGPSAHSLPASFSLPATGTIAVSKARLADSSAPGKDTAKLRITYTHDTVDVAGDLVWDPVADGLAVQAGDAAGPAAITIPPGAPGWKGRGARRTWRSPKGSLPKVVVTTDAKKRTVTVAASRFDYGRMPGLYSVVYFGLGEAGATYSGAWKPARGGAVEIR